MKNRKEFIKYSFENEKYNELKYYFSNIKKTNLKNGEIVDDVKYFAKLLKKSGKLEQSGGFLCNQWWFKFLCSKQEQEQQIFQRDIKLIRNTSHAYKLQHYRYPLIIYFVRHGHSCANILNEVYNTSGYEKLNVVNNTPNLTEIGIYDSINSGKILNKYLNSSNNIKNKKIYKIYSSTLLRAIATSVIIRKHLHNTLLNDDIFIAPYIKEKVIKLGKYISANSTYRKTIHENMAESIKKTDENISTLTNYLNTKHLEQQYTPQNAMNMNSSNNEKHESKDDSNPFSTTQIQNKSKPQNNINYELVQNTDEYKKTIAKTSYLPDIEPNFENFLNNILTFDSELHAEITEKKPQTRGPENLKPKGDKIMKNGKSIIVVSHDHFLKKLFEKFNKSCESHKMYGEPENYNKSCNFYNKIGDIDKYKLANGGIVKVNLLINITDYSKYIVTRMESIGKNTPNITDDLKIYIPTQKSNVNNVKSFEIERNPMSNDWKNTNYGRFNKYSEYLKKIINIIYNTPEKRDQLLLLCEDSIKNVANKKTITYKYNK
jgi:hypothetical protein